MKLSIIIVYTITILLNLATVEMAIASSGKKQYEQSCGRCHTAYDPEVFTSLEWPGVVRSMKHQAALSAEQEETIIEYLTSQSDAVNHKGGGFEPALNGYLYTEYFQTKEGKKNFDLHYLALAVSGWANGNIAYLAEFELEHGGIRDKTFVEQAYIDYWVKRNIAIKIGAMLTPFNRFDEFHAPSTNLLITRPQISREIGVSAWKDVGVNLHGFFNLNGDNSIGFDIYGINGLGKGETLRGSRQYLDNNEDIALGARAFLVNSMGLEVGGSFYNGAWDDNSDYDVNMFGAHLMLKTKIADFYGEFSSAISENPPDTLGVEVDDGEMSGYFFQVSKLIDKKYRPTLRYGALDYLDEGARFERKSTNKQSTDLALGFAYYPTSDVVFKIEYTIFTEGNRVTENKDNNQLGLQAAIKF